MFFVYFMKVTFVWIAPNHRFTLAALNSHCLWLGFSIYASFEEAILNSIIMHVSVPFFAHIFAKWHNVELFAIPPIYLSWFIVSARSSDWVSVATNRLLLNLSPLVLTYYRGLALNHGYRPLIDVIASSELVVSSLMTLFLVAGSRLTDTFKSDPSLYPGAACLVASSLSMTELVTTTVVCTIVGGIRYDMTNLLIAWTALKCVDRTVVPSILTFHLRPYFMQTDRVSVLPKVGPACVVLPKKNFPVPQSPLFKVPFSELVPLRSSMSQQAHEYLHRQQQISRPLYVPDFSVLVFY